MKAIVVYEDELGVRLQETHRSIHPHLSFAVLSFDVPKYLLPELLTEGVQCLSIESRQPEHIYAPKWRGKDGKPVEKLSNFDSIDLEYLRVCHKCIETYKKMLESNIDETQIRAVTPPFSIDKVLLSATINQWGKWSAKMLSSKDSLHNYYASKVISILK